MFEYVVAQARTLGLRVGGKLGGEVIAHLQQCRRGALGICFGREQSAARLADVASEEGLVALGQMDTR